MSNYGIEIINSSNRIQVDQNYSNIYPIGNPVTVNLGTSYPPSGTSGADLICVNVPASATGGEYIARAFDSTNLEFGYDTPSEVVYDAPNSMKYIIGRPFNGNVTPSTSGYGLQVFDTSGNVQFDTGGSDKLLRVLYVGNVSNNSVITVPSTTGTMDLSNIYVLLNSSTHLRILLDLGPFLGTQTDEFFSGYRFEYTSGNNGRIHVLSKHLFNGSPQTSGTSGNWNYMILEQVG